jgi:hypothetical protein
MFGLHPASCPAGASECGDTVVDESVAAPPGQPATLGATVTYPKPGRYIVRVEVGGAGAQSLCVAARGEAAAVRQRRSGVVAPASHLLAYSPLLPPDLCRPAACVAR